ncbi:hypothetical protein BKA62DRAFT_687804 [Auriculariales sp. MPI-PUGE-AT-0066]|nr:hypothetical protein BKA62DRAFT_687804 [Auriculariales sp. MPI-PUGE-AT-0066]
MSTAAPPPALNGDGNGRYRILIVGNSGTGKSTTMRRLSSLLGIPAVSLDLLHFKPGWTPYSRDEFRARVTNFIESNEEWIIDGNYYSKLGDLTFKAATDVIWLDPPRLLYWPRVFLRSILRIIGYHRNTQDVVPVGCDETFQSVFLERDSVLLWAITHHGIVRKRLTPMLAADPVEKGGKWRRLGGWGSEVQVWFERVEELAMRRRERAE